MSRETWKALREEHRQIGVPAGLEPKVLEQYGRTMRLRQKQAAGWLMAAAAVGAVVVGLSIRQPAPQPVPSNASAPPVAKSAAELAAVDAPTNIPAPPQIHERKPRSLLANARPIRPAVKDWPAAEPAERTTDFFAVPGAQYLPPASAARLLRVDMPPSALRRYGFDVPVGSEAGYVRADFVVGQDGLARAIRLVEQVPSNR
jgi:hypothetical protein